MNELELLKAKQAIFKMIGQFCLPKKMFDNDETLYIYNYCESALEAAFNVLNIEENYIHLMDFCKMWEDNDRAIWNICRPNDEYTSITADIHYKVFVEDYGAHLRWAEEDERNHCIKSEDK